MATNYYTNERPEMLSLVPADIARMLDVGCGEGAFAAAIQEQRRGLEVWGIEPVPGPAQVARGRMHRVVEGMFSPQADLPAGYFDLVSFNDSLEHMPDEVAALTLAHKLLRPGGYLMVSVPNVRYLDNLEHLLVDADWRYRDDGILDRTHLRFFTQTSIRRVVGECGFDVLQCKGINSRYWKGPKLTLLKLVFGRHMEDTRWQQFAVVARRC